MISGNLIAKKILSDIIHIPSSYPHEKELSKYIYSYLKRLGFKTTLQKVSANRYNVLAQKGKGAAILIFGHLDTVENNSEWETNPYSLTQKEDRLYGLGAWDMKGGIAAVLAAILEFSPKSHALKLAFVVDEEFVSVGTHTLINSGWLNDVKGAVVPEPGFTYGHKGIAIGRVGRSVYQVKVKTEGGHVYLYKDCLNAIYEARKVLSLIKNVKTIHHKNLGKSLIFPRAVNGGSHSMIIPDQVEIELESKLVPPQTTESLLCEIKSIINEARNKKRLLANVEISPVARQTPFCQPFMVDKNNPFVKMVINILKKTLNEKPILYYRHSVGDENRIAEIGIPVLTIGPEGGNAHESKEWVSEKSLYIILKIYKSIIETY